MTDLGWCTVQKEAAADSAAASFWTDVEALGRLPSYHSGSPPQYTAWARAIKASADTARREWGSSTAHIFGCAVPRHGSEQMQVFA